MRGQVLSDETPEELAELIEEGSLEIGTAFRLYFLVVMGGVTGRLVLVDVHGTGWEIYFRRGVPHFVRSSSPNLGLGRYLLAQRILDHDELLQAQALLKEQGGELIDVLSRCSKLTHTDIFRILAGYGRALLVRALAVGRGGFRWEAEVPAPESAAPLGGSWALLLEATRRLTQSEALARLGDRVNQPVMRAGEAPVRLEDLGLNAQETRLLSAFDGTRSLAQLAAAAPHETALIYRTGYFLSEVGTASFAYVHLHVAQGPQGAIPGGEEPASEDVSRREAFNESFTPAPANAIRASSFAGSVGAPPARAGSTAAVPPFPPRLSPTAPRTPPPVGVAKRAEPPAPVPDSPAGRRLATGAAQKLPLALEATEVQGFVESFGDKDHFEILGLPRTATSADVKRAYFQLARIHHPDTAPPGAMEIRKGKEQITARLNEAYAVLGDDCSRASYLGDLEVEGGTQEIDIANILEAERLFRGATLLVKARQFKQAVEELDRAIALSDSEGEFYAWRAFARFSSTPDKRQVEKECFAELNLAIEKSPNTPISYLFAGRISTVLGDVPGAIKYYKRCLALDANNVEAKRELRLLESRKSK